MATGNMPASMMKPMPSRITANMTSVKVKPERKRAFRARFEDVSFLVLISFASNQCAVVAVDQERDRILVDPGFLLRLAFSVVAGGHVAAEAGVGAVVEAAAADLCVGVAIVGGFVRLSAEDHETEG